MLRLPARNPWTVMTTSLECGVTALLERDSISLTHWTIAGESAFWAAILELVCGFPGLRGGALVAVGLAAGKLANWGGDLVAAGAVEGAQSPGNFLAIDALDADAGAQVLQDSHGSVIAGRGSEGRHEDAVGAQSQEVAVALGDVLVVDVPRRWSGQSVDGDSRRGFSAPEFDLVEVGFEFAGEGDAGVGSNGNDHVFCVDEACELVDVAVGVVAGQQAAVDPGDFMDAQVLVQSLGALLF